MNAIINAEKLRLVEVVYPKILALGIHPFVISQEEINGVLELLELTNASNDTAIETRNAFVYYMNKVLTDNQEETKAFDKNLIALTAVTAAIDSKIYYRE